MPETDRPILVPVDFSEDSEAALVWAARLADRTGHRLLILHVAHDPPDAPGRYTVPAGGGAVVPIEEVAARLLEDFVARVRDEHPELASPAAAETLVKTGVPRTRILEISDRVHAGHIVMGSQGRSGLGLLLMGSKAERVVRLATVPVTIVKSAAFIEKERAKKDKKRKKKEKKDKEKEGTEE